MTVQDLYIHATSHIDDYDSIASYTGANHLAIASNVVNELMTMQIGVNPTLYLYTLDSTYTAAYTATDTTKKPVALPAAISNGDQILSVTLDYDYQDNDFPTETNSGTLYVLIPIEYYGDIRVKYLPAAANFTAITDVLPISDRATIMVAALLLAMKISKSEGVEHRENLEQEYAMALRNWRSRYTGAQKKIRDVYNGWNYA